MMDQLYKRFHVPQNTQLHFEPDFKPIDFDYKLRPAMFTDIKLKKQLAGEAEI